MKQLISTLIAAGLLIALTAAAPADAQSSFRITGVTWEDTNCDGIRQDGEPLLPNMRLTLRWAGSNGIIDGTDRDIEQSGSLTGEYSFTLAGAGEPYFVSFRSEDKPAGHTLAPFQQGDDRTRDNDMTTGLLPGTSLWATPVFTMPLDGSRVTGYDIGLCKVVFDPAATVYLPLVIRP